jgi:hypothetical protein
MDRGLTDAAHAPPLTQPSVTPWREHFACHPVGVTCTIILRPHSVQKRGGSKGSSQWWSGLPQTAQYGTRTG